jgi:hypothetical protein
MEAPLSLCVKEEMRGVIRFLFAEGVKPVKIVRRMQAHYSDNCLSRSKRVDMSLQKWNNFCMRLGEIRKAVNVKD